MKGAGRNGVRVADMGRRETVGIIVHFFFQAEDGIRDGTVTGVQTCALPIFASAIDSPSVALETRRRLGHERLVGAAEIARLHADGLSLRLGLDGLIDAHRPFLRSEERRVGKSVDFWCRWTRRYRRC